MKIRTKSILKNTGKAFVMGVRDTLSITNIAAAVAITTGKKVIMQEDLDPKAIALDAAKSLAGAAACVGTVNVILNADTIQFNADLEQSMDILHKEFVHEEEVKEAEIIEEV